MRIPTEEEIHITQKMNKCERINRQKRNRETARKLAQLLAESQASYNDIDEIFRMSKQFLVVSFRDAQGLFDLF